MRGQDLRLLCQPGSAEAVSISGSLLLFLSCQFGILCECGVTHYSTGSDDDELFFTTFPIT